VAIRFEELGQTHAARAEAENLTRTWVQCREIFLVWGILNASLRSSAQRFALHVGVQMLLVVGVTGEPGSINEVHR
jgi:hypothetical protein